MYYRPEMPNAGSYIPFISNYYKTFLRTALHIVKNQWVIIPHRTQFLTKSRVGSDC